MSSNQERVFILKASEIDRLVAHKQTEALKTIFGVAKENPTAGWNELIMEAVSRLQKTESTTEANSVEELLPASEEVVEEVSVEEVAEPAESEVQEVENVEEESTEEPESVSELEPEEETDVLADANILADEEEPQRVKAFRDNDDSVLKSGSIFDD